MKLTTLLKICDVLTEDNYKTEIKVHTYKSFAFVKLEFYKDKDRYRESLFSASYQSKHVLQKLDGRKFENVEIKGSK